MIASPYPPPTCPTGIPQPTSPASCFVRAYTYSFTLEKDWSELHSFEDIVWQTPQDETPCAKRQLEEGSLVVEDVIEEGTVHVQPVVLVNNAYLAEPIHEDTAM